MATLPLFLNVLAEQQAALERPVDAAPAPLPVPNPTKSFWIDTPGANPLAKEGSEGPLTADADIAIIGSGITGVSAAYHLSRLLAQAGNTERSLKIVILEARDFCSGATGRNGGHLTANFFAEFVAYSALFGVDDARRAIALEQRTVSEIIKLVEEAGKNSELDLVAGGRGHLMFTELEIAAIKADYEAAKAAGIDVSKVEWLTKEQVEKEYGASYPAVRTPGYNIWPLKLVTYLYNLAKEAGVNSSTSALHLHTNTPVTNISEASSSAPRRWNLTTPRGSIAASYVLHATNAYASHLLPHLRGPSGIVPTRGQIIATRASVSESVLTRSAFTGNEGFEYWFPRPVEPGKTEPLVILGGGRESTKPDFELYVADDSAVNPKAGDTLRRFLPAVFPGRYEENREPEMEWSGIMGYTKTGDPFVGPVISPANPDAYKGQYISAGFTGHGMPRTFSCAEAVAQMILADIEGKEWTIPEWLPRHHLTENRLQE
ncbi:FAD dependent oxidoreductase [Trametes coccinea BRFM310]|uniref:FAD dependent oxidoreductase n=1 Tax=Trametes coccinea (strain BRFM310) TaxID=1353009 RepID=A0A1Y2I6C0_TRAC3|nr:FAD dependent oxidoreductase [Trametes coccinea BRFM310]